MENERGDVSPELPEQVFEGAPDGIVVVDRRGYVLSVNRQTEALFGYQRHELVGFHIGALLPERFRESHSRHCSTFFSARKSLHMRETSTDFFARKKGGREFPVDISLSRIHSARWGPIALAFIRDASERKNAATALRGANRALNVIRRCNQALVRATDEQSLLGEICGLIVTDGGYKSAWIDLKPIRERGQSPARSAIESGQPVISRGAQSSISVPLSAGERILGALNVRADEPDAFNPEEEGVLVELAADLAYGLSALRTKKKECEAEMKVESLAHYDQLTGLPNRQSFEDRLAGALEQAKRGGKTAAVVLVDLDHFNQINEALGFAAGDRLLKLVVGRLSDKLSDLSAPARTGSNEFGVILPDIADAHAAAVTAQSLLDEVARPVVIDEEIFISAAIGISMFPADGEDVQTLLSNCAAALTQAKSGGGGFYQFYKKETQAVALEHLCLDRELHHALERGEFMLEYQPVVELDTNVIIGVEALLRWQSPERGRVMPSDFIARAEESGVIVAIGAWVLETACAQNMRWIANGRSLIMSVNISPRQFSDPGLVPLVTTVIEKTGIDPALIELEIIERSLMDEDAGAALGALKDTGVCIGMDDFGTGYASLSALKRFPIDVIKIDRSFVHDIQDDAESAAIVRAVIALANDLGLLVVAEGVESPTELALLRSFKCRAAQGFVTGCPMPPEEITALLLNDASEAA